MTAMRTKSRMHVELQWSEMEKKLISNKKNKKKNPVLVWAGRVGATLLSTILILVIFLYAVMAMLVYGPSKTAKIQFVLSVQETSAIGC